MNMIKLSKTILTLLTAAFIGVSIHNVEAVPINGAINFSGSANGTQSGATSTLTFNNPMIVTSRTGDYSGVPLGTAVNWAAISWSGSGASAVLMPNNPLWSFVVAGTTYQLNLVSLSSAMMTANSVSIDAVGIATITGAINRDPTFYSLSVRGTGSNFFFTIGERVPEGGSAIVLLGLGVGGLVLLRRRCHNAPLSVIAAAAVASAVVSEKAHAQAVTGSIGFQGGGATATQSGGISTLTFNAPLAVDIRTGDYTAIPAGTSTTFAPISWSGTGTSAVLTSNNSPEWTIVSGGTTYQYSIVSLVAATVGMVMGQPAFSIQGTGIATISGAINRQPTYVDFSFQGIGNEAVFDMIQRSCIPGQCRPRLVTDAGNTLALLGGTVVALAGLRRKRMIRA